MAAWGLFEKKDVQSLNRVASARTMDGYKIRAKLALNFPRPVSSTEAEDVMMQYARAFAGAVECELSNGDLPFEEHEIHQRITEAVQVLPKKNVRLIGLHVWHKGAISSGSMLAVKPGEGKATVPAMPAVSQTRERAPAQTSAHTATTIKPDPRGEPPDPIAAGEPSPGSVRGPGAATLPAPNPAQRHATGVGAPANTPLSAPGVGRAATSSPAQRAPTVPSMPAARAAASVAPAGGGGPGEAPRPSPPGPVRAPAPNVPSVASRPTTAVLAGAARMMSGVVPAVEPRILRSKSGFLVALEQTSAASGDDVGQALAQPIRDAAAGLLLSTLDALHGCLSDPLALFDGRADAELRRALIGEACVCVCYILYESMTRTTLPQMQGIQVVQAACVHALSDKNMPVSEISRYLATESPREEFCAHVCVLLGAKETAELQQRVETALRGLRIDAKTCAEQIEARLGRPKAAGGR